jgi:hypothetical protein
VSYPYAFGTLEAATGTVAVTAASADVTGTGTAFLADFDDGGIIIINGIWRRVELYDIINPNTHVVADAPWPETLSGVTAYKLALDFLDTDLGIPAPKGVFVPYSQPLDLGDGSLRGGGWATAEWRWGFLSQAHREILREYIPGSSASLLIRTSINDEADAFYDFLTQAIWPAAEDRQAGRRMAFTLRFRAMQQKSFARITP